MENLNKIRFLCRKPFVRFLIGCVMWLISILLLIIIDPILISVYRELWFYIGMLIFGSTFFILFTIIYYIDINSSGKGN